jgi:type I restriction enzyme S subunit
MEQLLKQSNTLNPATELKLSMLKGINQSLPKGWEIKKLNEVCARITDGTHQTPKYFDEGYIFLSSKNVTSGNIDWDNVKYIDEKQHIEMYKRVAPKVGDILLAKNGTTGVAAMVDRDLVFDIYVSLAHLSPLKNISPYYLLHFINSPLAKSQFNKRLKGAGVPNLHLEEIREVEIPLPPLPEQQRIVSILDQAFSVIERSRKIAEQNLKNAKELFESYLQGVFEKKGEGWEEKTLEQVSITFGRGKSRHRPRNYEKLYGGDYPFIQTGDIRNCNHYITEFIQTYSELGLAQSKLWPSGTICITIAANIAETGVLTFDACFPDSVIGLVVNDKLADRDFVEYLLQSFKVRIQALGKGSAQANINMGTFENELFPFPPVKAQQTIVAKLDALSAETKRLEAIYKQKLLNLEELKKSVLQKAFNGEL